MGKQKVNMSYVSKASLKNVRVTPRKARLVVDLIRGRSVESALELLDFSTKKTAPLLKKLLLSAVANADDRQGVKMEELFVKAIWVDEGRVLRRWLPRAQGRATPLLKRSSHINIVLDEIGV